MGFKHFKFRIDTIIVLTLYCHYALVQGASNYTDPNNNYDNYNNDNGIPLGKCYSISGY